MGRPRKWPPSVYSHPTRNIDRIRINGHDIVLGPTGSAESRRNYIKAVAAAEQPKQVPAKDTGLTISDLSLWWTAHVQTLYGPASDEPRKYARGISALCEVCGSSPAADLTPRLIRAAVAVMLKSYSRSTTNAYLCRLKAFIRRACDEEVIPSEIHQRIACVQSVRKGAPGARETAPRKPTTRAVLDKIIAEVDAPVGAILELCWWTGSRPGEICRIRTCDVEQRTPASWVYRPARHKGDWRGHDRAIALGPKAINVLRPWLRPFEPERHCFLTVRGNPWRTDCLGQRIAEACERAGVKMTAYQLRHAFKRRAIDAGGIAAAMAALGQVSSVAFDKYDRGGDFDAAAELARKIG